MVPGSENHIYTTPGFGSVQGPVFVAGMRYNTDLAEFYGLYGFIWVYMGLYGFIWVYMGLYGFIMVKINQLKYITSYSWGAPSCENFKSRIAWQFWKSCYLMTLMIQNIRFLPNFYEFSMLFPSGKPLTCGTGTQWKYGWRSPIKLSGSFWPSVISG